MQINPGDFVKYRTRTVSGAYRGAKPGEILIGKVTERFRSLDGSYDCFWIEGQTELITEYQIIERI